VDREEAHADTPAVSQSFLTRTRWLRLERPENLTPKQEIGLGELLLRSHRDSFRTYRAVEVAPYHNLGRLPEPDFTHRFC